MLKTKNKITPDSVKWVTCGNCGHKIMKVVLCLQSPLYSGRVVFEVKCSSCKKINEIDVDNIMD